MTDDQFIPHTYRDAQGPLDQMKWEFGLSRLRDFLRAPPGCLHVEWSV